MLNFKVIFWGLIKTQGRTRHSFGHEDWPQGLDQVEVRELMQLHEGLQGLEVERLPVVEIWYIIITTVSAGCSSTSSLSLTSLLVLLLSHFCLTFHQETLRWPSCWVLPPCRETLRSSPPVRPAAYSSPDNWCPGHKCGEASETLQRAVVGLLFI